MSCRRTPNRKGVESQPSTSSGSSWTGSTSGMRKERTWGSGTGIHARRCFGLCFPRSPSLTANRATAGGPIDGGRGSNGGVWEWTSTVFDTHDDFAGTAIFPGYSSDFFDQKHHVVVSAKLFLCSICTDGDGDPAMTRSAWWLICNATATGWEENIAQLLPTQLPVRVDVGQGRIRCVVIAMTLRILFT